MSVRDRLRPSASLTASSFAIQDSLAQLSAKDNTRPFNRILLSCDDADLSGGVQRQFVFIRGVHRAIDFVRGNSALSTSAAAGLVVQRGDYARAAFTSPVMSRRHARLTFVDDGSVVIADVGSMHGTFMAGPNLIGALPDKLKPRRNYTLRDGDILVFGKPINRDDRDWKPVTIRVTLRHDSNDNASASQDPRIAHSSSSPISLPAELHSPYQSRSLMKESDQHAPNRFGMFINSAGSSVLDDDEDSSSSSASDADSHALSMSSPESSPLPVPRAPTALKVLNALAKRTSASIAPSSTSLSKSMSDEIESWAPTSGVNFDSPSDLMAPIRPSSASSTRDISAGVSSTKKVARSIWPTNFASITRLPSLKDLGLFRGSSTNVADQEPNTQNELGPCEKESLRVSGNEGEEADDASGDITFALSSPAKPAPAPGPPSTSSSQPDSLSQSRWAEPSFPQNQLGLNTSFGSGLGQSHSHDSDIRAEAEDAQRLFFSDLVSFTKWETAKPTSPAPLQSPSATPQDGDADKEEERRLEDGDEGASAMDISPLPSHRSTPNIRSVSIPDFAAISRQSQSAEKKERVVVNLVSDEEDQQRRKSATPKRASLRLPRHHHSSHRRRSKSRSRRETSQPNSQTRPVSVRELRTVMAEAAESSGSKEEKRGAAIETAVKELSELVKGFAERREEGDEKQRVGAEGKEEAAKEVKEMREEMRRLSDLVTALVEKVATRQTENGDSTSASDTVEGSRKRKRDPNSDADVELSQSISCISACEVDAGLDMCVEQLESEISRLQSASSPVPSQSFALERETGRAPAKRSRVESDDGGDGDSKSRRGSGIGRSVASAAGFTTLGAALAWATLAYAL